MATFCMGMSFSACSMGGPQSATSPCSSRASLEAAAAEPRESSSPDTPLAADWGLEAAELSAAPASVGAAAAAAAAAADSTEAAAAAPVPVAAPCCSPAPLP